VHTGFWWGNLREIDNLEHLGTDRIMILKSMLKKWDKRRWTGFVWLKTGLLLTRPGTFFGCHKVD